MTWGDVKLAALQRIFSNDGAALNRDDSNEEYLNAMPAVANEALSIITGVGIPLLKKLTVEVSEAVTEPEQDGQTLRIPLTENGVARIDMREAAADYRALESGELYWETARDGYGPAGAWSVEGCDTLVLPVDEAAIYTVYYRAYVPTLTASTPDNQELGVPREAAELVPLYIGAQLYREDDIQISTQMLNEFEVGLSRLQQAGAERPAGGGGRTKNTTKWWN